MEKQETKEARPRRAKAPAKAKKRKRRRLSQKPPKDEVARVRLALAAVVAELRTQQELAPETLAARARITVRELVRCEEGKPGTLETFAALGGALGYDPGDVLHLAWDAAGLHRDKKSAKPEPPATATLESIRGEVQRLLAAGACLRRLSTGAAP